MCSQSTGLLLITNKKQGSITMRKIDLKQISLKAWQLMGGIIFAVISAFVATSAFADTPAASAPAVSGVLQSWAKLSLQGDHVRMRANSLPVYKINEKGEVGDIVSLGINSCFRVNQEVDSASGVPSTVSESVDKLGGPKSSTPIYITLESQEGEGIFSTPNIWPSWICGAKKDTDSVPGGADTTAKVGDTYLTSREVLEQRDHMRYGFTYGVLITPFKFYTGGDSGRNHVAGQTTIGGYVGYRFYERNGTSSVFAVSAGPVSATGNNTTNGSTVNVNGASVAIAYLAEIKERFTAGFIMGKDFYEKPEGVDVPINAKLWIGVNLGVAVN
jgi:hypothetical protein